MIIDVQESQLFIMLVVLFVDSDLFDFIINDVLLLWLLFILLRLLLDYLIVIIIGLNWLFVIDLFLFYLIYYVLPYLSCLFILF